MILLLAVFIIVPLAELYVIIKVGGSIGIGPTIAILLIDSLIGAFLLRQQGRSAWVSFNRAIAESRVPHKEVLDGVLVIFGAALLLTPGFITDIFGLILLIPPTRAVIRAVVARLALGRLALGSRAAMWSYGRVRKRQQSRGAGPDPAGNATPRGGPAGAEDFGWTTPEPAGPRPGDIEGTAQEVRDGDDEARLRAEAPPSPDERAGGADLQLLGRGGGPSRRRLAARRRQRRRALVGWGSGRRHGRDRRPGRAPPASPRGRRRCLRRGVRAGWRGRARRRGPR